jgi:hypothetical protein
MLDAAEMDDGQSAGQLVQFVQRSSLNHHIAPSNSPFGVIADIAAGATPTKHGERQTPAITLRAESVVGVSWRADLPPRFGGILTITRGPRPSPGKRVVPAAPGISKPCLP